MAPDTADVERRFRGALRGTSHWKIVRGRLELFGATGKPLAVFPPPDNRRPPIGELVAAAGHDLAVGEVPGRRWH